MLHILQAELQAGGVLSGPKSFQKAPLTAEQRPRILAAMRGFLESADTQDQALALYVNSKVSSGSML